MSVRGGGRARLRRVGPVMLMPVAAFVVHQLRYYLAYGSAAGAVLERTGHSYLHSLVPWVVMLVAFAVGGFLWALGRAVAGQRSMPRYTVSLFGLWLACSVCLVAIFATQEFLEGVFATGHPVGWLGFSGLVGGGRSRPRRVWVWSSPCCFTALVGCWTRSLGAICGSGQVQRLGWRRPPGPRMCGSRGWRRWPRVGRAVVLLDS